jgi:hypothetical protein
MLHMWYSRIVENHPIRILEDGPLISERVLSHLLMPQSSSLYDMPHLPTAHHETSKRNSLNETMVKERQNKTVPNLNSNLDKSMSHHNQTKERTTWFLSGVILWFLPFGFSSMAIRHLSMINSMNAILFLLCKIISHQEIWSQIIKLILLLLCKIISY